jgi:Na+:H+ antiporter, NhaA family
VPPAHPEDIRPPWSRSDRAVPRVIVRPLQAFLRSSTASALPMLVALLVALVWVNSPWWRSYEQVWLTPIVLRLGRWAIVEDLRFWVDEGLMTLFFLLAGLEIKRELATGELRDRRRLIAPGMAAIGGMLVPALVFLAFVRGTAASGGWGMAMPTDLAFALAILVLASRALPSGVRPFLLMLAILDDLLTVAVVALLYAGHLSGGWLLLALALVGVMVVCERAHVQHLLPYVVLGILLWLCVYEGGVHPALVGALLGLLAPARPFNQPAAVSAAAHRIADRTADDPDPADADAASWLELARLSNDAVSPLARTEHALLPWVNLFALPLFALANAGVRLSGRWWSGRTELLLIVGLVTARLFGKAIGIVGAGLLAKRWRFAQLPADLGLGALAGLAVAAGAPFTVSLFVASGAYPQGSTLLAAARVGVLVSLAVCGLVGAAVLRAQSFDGEPR